MRTRFVLVALMLAGLALLAAACRAPAKLEGTAWVLRELDGSAPLDGAAVTLVFEEEQLRGSAGCNRFFGSYEVDGKTLTIGALGSTKMACHDPEGVMNQEQRYLELLGTAERYEVRDGELRITTSGGATLVFAAQE